MARRWNLCSPVPYTQGGEEKTKWLQLGVMFENKAGTGFNMILDAMPASTDGKMKIMAFPPDNERKTSGFKASTEPLDDEIAF